MKEGDSHSMFIEVKTVIENTKAINNDKNADEESTDQAKSPDTEAGRLSLNILELAENESLVSGSFQLHAFLYYMFYFLFL